MTFNGGQLFMRRLIVSPFILVLAMTVAVGGMAWSTSTLEARRDVHADHDGMRNAETIAATVVRSRLQNVSPEGSLAREDFSEMRADVQQLYHDGCILALGLWRLDGARLLLHDPSSVGVLSPSAADLARIASGEAWTIHATDDNGRETLRVMLPAGLQGPPDNIAGVVQVVLPHDQVLQAAHDELVGQQVLAALLLVIPVVGLAMFQRRMRMREREMRTDQLTGLGNRRALHEDARKYLLKASVDRPVILLLIDLANFKNINNTLGHAAGDQLLRQVAETLTSAVRSDDVLARLGGDDFAIMATGLRNATEARRWAKQILHELRTAAFVVDGVNLVIDARIGLALAPEHGASLPELLQHADIAMYEAKRENVGTTVYDPNSDTHTVDQLEMVAELHRALANEEFLLHYQPKVSLLDGNVTSAEALLRWQHPTRGLLPPGVFLPALESSGLMQPVTRWVLREAVRQAASWRRSGMPLPVAININPRSLLEDDLTARVLATLSGADLPASFLELEITETAVMTDPERAASVVAQLKARDVRVSIDDFGAGYTSLAHLRSLPVAALKLDRSLISHLLERPEDHAITEALIGLAHRLGLSVVAEGIETEDVMQRLIELGCDEAQGYLISAPVHPSVLERWLLEQRRPLALNGTEAMPFGHHGFASTGEMSL
jgi:diguanylate cyclase (GGDEF)-like protein